METIIAVEDLTEVSEEKKKDILSKKNIESLKSRLSQEGDDPALSESIQVLEEPVKRDSNTSQMLHD